MHERLIKRLLVALAVAIMFIMVAKFFLARSLTQIGEAKERKRSAMVQPASAPVAADAPATDPPLPEAASAVPETGAAVFEPAAASAPVEAGAPAAAGE